MKEPARSTGYSYGPKPYKFIGFGDSYGPKPYKFIRFGDSYGPKPYEFIGFGDILGPKPFKWRRRGAWVPEGSLAGFCGVHF